MQKPFYIFLISIALCLASCQEVLEPKPVDLLIDELALNEASDVPSAELGLYSALRATAAPTVLAGDFTADLLVHNGTFSQFRELGTKQILATNATVDALWGSLYNTIYIANFILERLPAVPGVPASRKAEVLATAHLFRGYCYFIAAYTFGDVPLVTTTDLAANRRIARTAQAEILQFVAEEYFAALDKLPKEPSSGFAGKYTVEAALARYYLYAQNWDDAEGWANSVITNSPYKLEESFADIVQTDFTDEAILEMGYTITDDPGTGTYSLNNLFEGRREVIPSNQAVFALNNPEAGERKVTIAFVPDELEGSDNGWKVEKYGTADEDNNNIVLFRLAEMYLIRAEARARQNNISGSGSAQEDINVLRARAKAPLFTATNQGQTLQAIERERLYELAYEGHRWYDLKRTGRLNEVMQPFSANWKQTYNLWPIPQTEIQNNPLLANAQNPGY